MQSVLPDGVSADGIIHLVVLDGESAGWQTQLVGGVFAAC